jgi:hypothetical protein
MRELFGAGCGLRDTRFWIKRIRISDLQNPFIKNKSYLKNVANVQGQGVDSV